MLCSVCCRTASRTPQTVSTTATPECFVKQMILMSSVNFSSQLLTRILGLLQSQWGLTSVEDGGVL